MSNSSNPNPASSDEWMTPEWVLVLAIRSMGWIDLDPCSTYDANLRVGAELYYDKELDGLTKPWRGNVFINPPYSRGIVDKFVDKLLLHWANGRGDVMRAFMITNSVTDTVWAHRLFNAATAVCFLRGRVHFLGLNGEPVTQTRQGQALWFFGDTIYTREFRDACEPHGVVLQRVSKTRETYA